MRDTDARYDTLLDALRRSPDLYGSTGIAFWDDEHISEAMLRAHLSQDHEGASRNRGFMEKSADWIAGLRTAGGNLLDLGCGPGLYAELFDDRGFRVTGVDLSGRSIAYAMKSAAKRGKDIRYLRSDYLALDFEGEFDIAALIYCYFGVLPPESRSLFLRLVRAALKPGGVFVFDVFTPAQYADFRDSESVSGEESGFWSGDAHALIRRNRRYRDDHFLEQYVVVTRDACRTYNIWNHAFTREELAKDLREAGFGPVEFYADAAGAPYESDDKTICAVSVRD